MNQALNKQTLKDMNKALVFIKKAKALHGDKYDYTNSIYVRSKEKIFIKCNCCKQNFEQMPQQHLKGYGCPSCNRSKIGEEFLKKAKVVHGDKYDYSKTVYVFSALKVIITCNGCKNDFKQIAASHLMGNGCPFCNKNRCKSTEQFVADAKAVHGDKYDYSKTKYIHSLQKVKIICNGCKQEFEQIAASHLMGSGCSFCKKTRLKSTEQFIADAKAVHGDKYDYSKTKYIHSLQKVQIICNGCKQEFEQIANNHLEGNGCKACRKGKVKALAGTIPS